MGYLPARRRPARADSSPVRILARAGIAGPIGRPRAVHGAIVTSGLFRMRFTFPAVAQVRMNARSPSTAILTGVFTGVPSRRSVVSRTVRCRAKDANDAADASRTSAMARLTLNTESGVHHYGPPSIRGERLSRYLIRRRSVRVMRDIQR